MTATQDEKPSVAAESIKVREDAGNAARASAPRVPHLLTHKPDISSGSVDVTGIVPEDVIIHPQGRGRTSRLRQKRHFGSHPAKLETDLNEMAEATAMSYLVTSLHYAADGGQGIP